MDKKRKLIAFLATLLIVSLLCGIGKIVSADFVDLVKAAFWAFVVGNGAEHLAEMKK